MTPNSSSTSHGSETARGLDPPAVLLNYGCAGAHRDDLGPGDVVLGERIVHVTAHVVLSSGERKPMGFDYQWLDASRDYAGTSKTIVVKINSRSVSFL